MPYRIMALLSLLALMFASVSRAEVTVTRVDTSAPYRIFNLGEPLTFTVQVKSTAPIPPQVPLVVRQLRNFIDDDDAHALDATHTPAFEGLYGYLRAMEEEGKGLATATTTGDVTTLTFTLPTRRLGALRVSAVLNGQEVKLADFLHVMPQNNVSARDTYFSISLSEHDDLGKYNRAGIRVVRWETGIQYRDKTTTFDFTNGLKLLNDLKKNNLQAFLIIGHDDWAHMPQFPGTGATIYYWGGGTPETQCPPARMPEFGRWCGEFATTMKGYVRGYEFFNEPWEAGSISGASGGGAQVRRLLQAGAPAVKKADPAAKVVAGCSVMNEEDSFFPYPETVSLVDVFSTHTYYNWYDWGPAIISKLGKEYWDTESWCVMADDFSPIKTAHEIHQGFKLVSPMGTGMDITGKEIWTSGSASYITSQRFLDGMKPAGVAMKGKVPIILLFQGRGQAVAFLHEYSMPHPGGDIGGHDNGLPGNVPYSQIVKETLAAKYQPRGTFTILAVPGVAVYDIFGNPLPKTRNTFGVPMERFGYYVTAPTLKTLKLALDASQLTGVPSLSVKIHDFTERLAPGAALRIAVTNVYPVEKTATVTVDGTAAGITFDAATQQVAISAGKEATVSFTVKTVDARPLNKYHIAVTATDGVETTRYAEDINQAIMVKGTPVIDGDLADWDAFKPVPVIVDQNAQFSTFISEYLRISVAQAVDDAAKAAAGKAPYVVTAQAAWDARNFYLGAKVVDATEGRKESAAFGVRYKSYPWPNQHLYMGGIELTGCAGDTLMLSFNTNDDNQRLWNFKMPDDPLYRVYPWPDTDFEYEVYPVKYNKEQDAYMKANFPHYAKWPGYPESEVWRLYDPKMTYRHHAYPFNPPFAEYDQAPVPGAQSVVKRDGNVWTYELAIPWSQIWEVQPKAGTRVRFTFYTRNDGNHALEYAAGKSVSVRNPITFHPMWEYHWSNDCEWGFVE